MVAFTVDIITNAGSSSKPARSRIGTALFNSVTHFVGKKPVPPKTKGSEKVVLIGFTVFTLFVLSTFTGAITESLINDYDSTE